MVKLKRDLTFMCSACGLEQSKWLGKCPGCQQWNTIIEETPNFNNFREAYNTNINHAVSVSEIVTKDNERTKVGIGEFDRVLGGGFVSGSAILLAGEPGIGKSTLLITAAHKLALNGVKTLYVSAEESLHQAHLTARRLNAIDERFFLMAETDLASALSEVERLKPAFLILDSVQTFSARELDSAPGTIGQIREVARQIINMAKDKNICTILVGHITKDGQIAGPRLLEHMVDTVLYFESTRGGHYRILRSQKNRFGSTNEIGVFEMHSDGLCEVANPSASYLAERPRGKPGSTVTACMEGTRPLLVEVQALCVPTMFGNPRRTAQGVDGTRCVLLAAVLERHVGLVMSNQDLFINVAAGANLVEPASDLPVAVAIASSLRNRPVRADLLMFGEIGLSGEVRAVPRTEARLEEAFRLGFKEALVPRTSAVAQNDYKGLRLTKVSSLSEAVEAAIV